MDNQHVKSWWASTTIWGAIGVIIVAVLSAFGADVADGDAAAIGSGLGSIATGVFALVAIWGRINASKRIG